MLDTIEVRPFSPPTVQSVGGFSRHIKHINTLSKIAIAVEPVAQARIAACLVYQNQIISVGINQRKSHPFQKQFGKNSNAIFLHAETDCIKNALREYTIDHIAKCSLYVCRVKHCQKNKDKFVFGLAKPCEGCTRAIVNFGISKVCYSTDEMGVKFL